MDITIKVAPTYLELKQGEEKQIQIITDMEDYGVIITDTSVAQFDRASREVLGLKSGYTDIEFFILDKEGKKKVARDSLRVDVLPVEKSDTPVRLMLHNRFTNRISFLQGAGLTEDVQYLLPRQSGELLTRHELEGHSNFVSKPSIIFPDNAEPQHKCNFKVTQPGFKVNHTANELKLARWQFATDHEFKDIILEKTNDNKDTITELNVSLFDITAYVRVRYEFITGISEWSAPLLVTFSSDVPLIENTAILSGSMAKVAYYGEMDALNYVGNYDYRGDYTTLVNANLKDFKVGQQVSHRGKLYVALKEQTENAMGTPGIDNDVWQEDKRVNLPSFPMFVKKIGLGLGVTDNNEDGYSYGSTRTGSFINSDTTKWLKFGYKGKILYVASDRITDSIAWNDLAKINVVYGNRTLKIGNSLYRIRLLTVQEYRDIFVEFLPTVTSADGKFKYYDKVFVHDLREGIARKIISKSGQVTELPAGDRSGSYRPVLELVKEGCEPYKNLPKCVTPYNYKLNYDPYTDTGYFGVVAGSNLRAAPDVLSDLKWTAGGNINTSCDWYMFYYQGLILYTPTKIIRSGFRPSFGKQENFLYPTDLGHGRKKKVIKDGVEYYYGLFNGSTYTPRPLTIPNDQRDTVAWGDGSMWNSLILRMFKGYVNTKNYSGYVCWSGYQIGNNWSDQERKGYLPNEWEIYTSDYKWMKGSNGGIEYNADGGRDDGNGSDDTAALLLMLKPNLEIK